RQLSRRPSVQLGATVKLCKHELTVTKRFSCGQATVAGCQHRFDQRVASSIEIHLTPQDARNIEVDMFGHRPYCAWVGRELDHRFDRITDNIALSGREQMDCETACTHQGYALGRPRRCIHEVQTWPF